VSAAWRVETSAPAKVNLILRVLGRRPDGRHDLLSLVTFAPLADEVTVQGRAGGAGWSVACACPDRPELDGPGNLAARAAVRMLAGVPGGGEVRITLGKRIPVAAGLGGGSADAAAVLRVLAAVLGLPLPAWAAELGADVPVCLHGRPAWVSGFGEVVTPAPGLPPHALVLVDPGFPVSTAAAFAALAAPPAPLAPPPLPGTPGTFADLAARVENDLAAPLVAAHPEVRPVLDALRAAGAAAASVSGSGPVCLGLFRDREAAWEARGRLERRGIGRLL
jgi:4-diphosphocytidyl-2-C-methyl-D-erythritol kinase